MGIRMGFCTTLCATMIALPVFADTMYGGGSGQQDGKFGIVDQATGDFTVLGDPTVDAGEGLSGIAFGTDGRLWGSVPQGGGGNSGGPTNLIEIDPVTGQLINDVGPIKTPGGDDLRIVDLALQPSTNTLFGLDIDGKIYTLDKGTAVATLVGDPGVTNRGGIAFSPFGIFYLVEGGGSHLWRIDPATGATIGSAIDISDSPCLDGLAVRPSDGVLFATECDGRAIVRINPVTGDSVQIDPADREDDVADLAFRITRPTSTPAVTPLGIVFLGSLLLLAGLHLSRRRVRAAAV